jgi:YfiH family protein
VDDAVVGGVTPEGADGLVTDRRGVTTMTLSADCVLVLLYDPVRRAIANVHSSRHGTLAGISLRALERLREDHGSRPTDLVAALGPSIGPCCYEVRDDVAGVWRARHGERHLLRRGERTVLDLWGAVRGQLEAGGVRAENIDVAGICTRCHPETYFSYRRDGERTGRFGALLWLRE